MILRKIYDKIRENRTRCNFIKKATLEDAKTIKIFRGASVLLFSNSRKEDIVIAPHCLIYGLIASSNRGKVEFGKYSQLGNHSLIRCVESVKIGEYTAIADNVIIQDNNSHPVNPFDRIIMQQCAPQSVERNWSNSQHAPINIGNNCWIGENSRICKGVVIGDGSIVAANSVVTKSVPANCIVAGNPAKVVKRDIDISTDRFFKDSDYSDCVLYKKRD